jgi:hypothetical protein
MEVGAVQILKEPGRKRIDGDIGIVIGSSVEISDVGDFILHVPDEKSDMSVI